HIEEPGAYFKLPWPVQKVQKFDKRLQNFEDKFEETLTQDGKNLLVNVYAGWRIKDAALFRERFDGSVANAERSLEGLVRDAKNAVIGQHRFGDFISTNPAELKFEQIEDEMLVKIKGPALANYGIEVRFLGIKKLGLPESITAKVFERMKQERQKYVQEIQGKAERESIRIRSAADRERAEIIAKAQGEATRLRGQAEAEASQSLRALEQNPELALFLLKLNSMEEVLKERATLILDQRTPPFDLLKGISPDTTKPGGAKP
ncbi:MAG: protease modulator HflC, partial [Verrucomicrobia bacterium]|nr:protease modulator HflC [Verrucomicrobiota bacterium]